MKDRPSKIVAAIACLAISIIGLVAPASTALPAVAASTTQAPATAATPYTQWASNCHIQGLDYAQVLPTDKANDGTPVKIRPDLRGDYTPILMVHGWVGTSKNVLGQDGKPSGQFSRTIDLSTSSIGTVDSNRSLLGNIQDLGGTAVYTFDYQQYSARWVTDFNIGDDLNKAIRCLYQASGQKVIIVSHSMGGLATRQALTGYGDNTASMIRDVLEFGTPNTGSVAAAMANNALNAAAVGSSLDPDSPNTIAVLRILLSQCGAESTKQLSTPGTLCTNLLPPPIRAFRSAAGLALEAGSHELQALSPMPTQIPVHALAGNVNFTFQRAGLFNIPLSPLSASIGDEIVTVPSATNRSQTQDIASCRYETSPTAIVSDGVLKAIGLKTANEVGRNPGEVLDAVGINAFRSPCFHSNLTETIQLTNDALGYIKNDIDTAQGYDPLNVQTPELCRHPPGNLVNGSLPNVPSNSGGAWAYTVTSGPDKGRPRLATAQSPASPNGAVGAMILGCNAGGVSWPDTMAFYANGGKLLGSELLGDVSQSERGSATEITISGNTATVTWVATHSDDAQCCGHVEYTADFTWTGQKVVASNIQTFDESNLLHQLLNDLQTNNLTDAGTIASTSILAELTQLGTAGVLAPGRCFGVLDTYEIPAMLRAKWPLGFMDNISVPMGESGVHRFCVVNQNGNPAGIVEFIYQNALNTWTATAVKGQ